MQLWRLLPEREDMKTILDKLSAIMEEIQHIKDNYKRDGQLDQLQQKVLVNKVHPPSVIIHYL